VKVYEVLLIYQYLIYHYQVIRYYFSDHKRPTKFYNFWKRFWPTAQPTHQKAKNLDPTQPNPTRGSTQPMDNSAVQMPPGLGYVKPLSYIASDRQHSELSVVSWRSDLRGAVNTQQLRRQNFCSRWTSLVKLYSGPAAQLRYHLVDCSDDSWRGSLFLQACDFWYAAP